VMESWFHVLGTFGEAHSTVNRDGSPYSVSVTDHNGVGGCGTHDTRVTFQMRPEQQQQVAELIGWSEADLKLYFQAALNLVPVHPATSPTLDPFYVKCIDTLTKSNGGYKPLMRMPDDEYKTIVEDDTVAEASLAMFSETGVRWISALLLDNDIRPPNLKILSETCVNKMVIEQVIEQGSANMLRIKNAWLQRGSLLPPRTARANCAT
jgi:hypothetical protein